MTGEPITALFVDHATDLGGAEYSLLELLEHLNRDRISPVLVTRPGALADAAGHLGVATALAPLGRLRAHPAAPLLIARGALALRRIARARGARVVHANVLRAAVYSAAMGPGSPPLVWHVRDILGGKTPRLLCARARKVVAISKAVAQSLPCRARAQVVYNPISWAPPAGMSREQLGLPEGPLVAIVGRIRPWKGQADFLAACAMVEKPGTRFLVIGGRVFDDKETADYSQHLRDRAAALGLADKVVFTGQRSDLAEVWPHLALLVHTAEAEPFGRAVAEAQAAGVPVVAYRDGGVPEIVDDGVTGILVDPGDVAGVAAAVDALLADDAGRAAMGARAITLARGAFDPRRHAETMAAVLADAATAGGRHPGLWAGGAEPTQIRRR